MKKLALLIGFVSLSWCDEWLQGNLSRELDDVGEVGRNRVWDRFIDVIRTAHGDSLLAGIVGLQRAEARSIKIYDYND